MGLARPLLVFLLTATLLASVSLASIHNGTMVRRRRISHHLDDRSLFRLAPRATSLPGGWSDQGCYIDYSWSRTLQGYYVSSPDMTPSKCANTCKDKGFVSVLYHEDWKLEAGPRY